MVNQFGSNGMPVLILVIFALVCFILLALVIVLFIRVTRLKQRLDSFMSEDVEASLRDTVIARFEHLDMLEKAQAVNEEKIKELNYRLKGVYQKTGIVKYDAFEENGGRLSFSLALLDDRDDGVLLNVMNAREGSYCYIKEISHGSCDITLGREEEEALRIASGEKSVERREKKHA